MSPEGAGRRDWSTGRRTRTISSDRLGDIADTAEANRAFVRRHYEKLAGGDWRGAAEDYAEEASNFGRAVGREGVRRVLEDIYTTFPDWSMEIEEMAVEAENVVVRCRVSGMHRGIGKLPVNGGKLVGVEPSGKPFEVQHIHWYKVRDGQFVDHYAVRDDLGMMSQLGF